MLKLFNHWINFRSPLFPSIQRRTDEDTFSGPFQDEGRSSVAVISRSKTQVYSSGCQGLPPRDAISPSGPMPMASIYSRGRRDGVSAKHFTFPHRPLLVTSFVLTPYPECHSVKPNVEHAFSVLSQAVSLSHFDPPLNRAPFSLAQVLRWAAFISDSRTFPATFYRARRA